MPWRPASFRGKKVWVEVDHLGKLTAEGGRVPMRYSDKAGVKIYRAGVANLKVEARGTVDLPPGIRVSGCSNGTTRRSSVCACLSTDPSTLS